MLLNWKKLTKKAFKSFPPSKIKYFTGLPSLIRLMAVFNFIAPYVPNNHFTLPKFQQFLMVLMKLCLNVGDQYLAYCFKIHNSTVSWNFKKWINVMYMRLKPIIKWPAHDELLLTRPMIFRRNCKTCVIIIDCFEVFIERPTSLKHRAQTWSN